VRVNDDDFVLHEDHLDIDVLVPEQGDVGLKVVRKQVAAAVLSELTEDPFGSGDVAKDSTPELRFVNAPPISCIALSRLAQPSFIQFTGALHMLDLVCSRPGRQILLKYVLTLLHIIG